MKGVPNYAGSAGPACSPALLAALKSYRCQYTVDHDGDALHLVDVLSAGETIAEGQREIELLAEHLSLAIDESNAEGHVLTRSEAEGQ